MKTETEVLEMLLERMKQLQELKSTKALATRFTSRRIESIVGTLKEVLNDDPNLYLLPSTPYAPRIKLAVAHLIRDDAEKSEVAVVVDLYHIERLDFRKYATTDGWLVSEIDENVPYYESKVKNRKLFIPSMPIIDRFGDTYGEAYFDEDGQPMTSCVSYSYPTDEQQTYALNWTNIETGERLHQETPQP